MAAVRSNFEILTRRALLVGANKRAGSRVPFHACGNLRVFSKRRAEALATFVIPVKICSTGCSCRLKADALALLIIPAEILATATNRL